VFLKNCTVEPDVASSHKHISELLPEQFHAIPTTLAVVPELGIELTAPMSSLLDKLDVAGVAKFWALVHKSPLWKLLNVPASE
jgi:hypothetical protein